MWIVGETNEVASKLLDYCKLLCVVRIIESICFSSKVIMHADTAKSIWLAVEQEAGVRASIDSLVDDIRVVSQAIRTLISVIQITILVDLKLDIVEMWISCAMPQVEIASGDSCSECLLLAVACL